MENCGWRLGLGLHYDACSSPFAIKTLPPGGAFQRA
jgi:hypothetical protein